MSDLVTQEANVHDTIEARRPCTPVLVEPSTTAVGDTPAKPWPWTPPVIERIDTPLEVTMYVARPS